MSSQPLLSARCTRNEGLSLLQRAISMPIVKCILPPLLLQLIVTLTRRMHGQCSPAARVADGLLAIHSETACVGQSEMAFSAGASLHKNFILTRLNMVSFADSLRKRLKDRAAEKIHSQLDGFPPTKRLKHTVSTRPPKLAPNHFVAIQITNPEIVSACVEVQHELIQIGGKRFEPALIKPSKFHLTLMVMHLAPDNQRAPKSSDLDLDSMNFADREPASARSSAIATEVTDENSPAAEATQSRAKEALDACAKRLRHLTDANLTVNGVGTFGGQVIFASVDECVWLNTVIDTVAEEFKRLGIESTDKRPVTPHLTLMKLSQIRGHRSRELRRFDTKKLSGVAEAYFGVQTVTSLQLCAMHSPKKLESGYYHIEHEVALT